MNYSDLPVYIKKQTNDYEYTYSNIAFYDPPGDENAIIIENKSINTGASLQYLNSPFARITGNSGNWAELYTPRITGTNTNYQIYVPNFRSLVFYNLDGSRVIDPRFGGSNTIPILYAYDYDTGSSTINYINIESFPDYIALRWSGANDRYSLDWYNDEYAVANGLALGTPLVNLFYASGTGFSSGWSDYSTSAYTGIVCSGFGIKGYEMVSTINDPTGNILYHYDGIVVGSTYARNSTFNSNTGITGTLLASVYSWVDYTTNPFTYHDATGYVFPHTRLNLGANYPYVPAASLSLDYQSQSSPKRKLGIEIDPDDQITAGQSLQTKVSFNAYINTEFSGALNEIINSTGNDLYTIKFGNDIFSGCYLNDYNVSIEPFKPVVLSANYIVNNAPKINLNKEEFVSVLTDVGSTNQLLYSNSLSGLLGGVNKWTQTLVSGFSGQSDPLGGNNATKLISRSAATNLTKYENSQTTETYSSITGNIGATYISSLSATTDATYNVAFASSKTFSFYDATYSSVYISSNGLLSFGAAYNAYIANISATNTTSIPFIAAYWRDLSPERSGKIYYEQQNDRLIIEFSQVATLNGTSPVTFQIHLIFATGEIRIIYDSIKKANFFKPQSADPLIGVYKSSTRFHNYLLNTLVETNGYLSLNTLIINPTTLTSGSVGSIIYNSKITPDAYRTFSIYLKRGSGTGEIRYTLDNGSTSTEILNVTTSWQRFTFPATKSSQRVGIIIVTNSDELFLFGAQLENLFFSTEYIYTAETIATRQDEYQSIAKTIFPSPIVSNDFANTMVNGNTCSISSTTGFINNVQSSIRYSIACNRTPVYTLNNINASSFLLNSIDKSIDISSTDLQSFIDFSGSKLGTPLNITLKNASGIINNVFNMKSGSNILSQQMTIQEGDTLTTQVSIKEVVV